MAKRYWVKEAFAKNKGALHRELDVAAGEKIPSGKLRKAMKSKGRLGRRARLAMTARGFQH